MQQPSDYPIAPLRHRLLALVYDSLLLLAALFCTAMLYLSVIVISAGPSEALLNAQEGDVLTTLEPVEMGWPIYPLMLAVYVFFYCYCWKKSGQTLGMRAWKIRLVGSDNQAPSLRQCLVRLVAAPLSFIALGAGYWVLLFNRRRGTWHDRLSSTQVVLEKKK